MCWVRGGSRGWFGFGFGLVGVWYVIGMFGWLLEPAMFVAGATCMSASSTVRYVTNFDSSRKCFLRTHLQFTG